MGSACVWSLQGFLKEIGEWRMGGSVIIHHQGGESNNNYVVRISFKHLLDTIPSKVLVIY